MKKRPRKSVKKDESLIGPGGKPLIFGGLVKIPLSDLGVYAK